MVQTMNFIIMEPSPLPISSLFGPKIRLRILFSNTLSLHFSLNVRDHVLQPYSTTERRCLFTKSSRFDSWQWRKISLVDNYLLDRGMGVELLCLCHVLCCQRRRPLARSLSVAFMLPEFYITVLLTKILLPRYLS